MTELQKVEMINQLLKEAEENYPGKWDETHKSRMYQIYDYINALREETGKRYVINGDKLDIEMKIGNVELYESEVREIYKENKYIMCYSKVYQICYSQNAGYYGLVVYRKPKSEKLGLTLRGRYFVMDAKTINKVIGSEILK